MTIRLYVVPGTPNSRAAEANLSMAVRELGRDFDYEIVDVLKKPDWALRDGVLVTPTLIALSYKGSPRMIGRLEPLDVVVQFLEQLSKVSGDEASAALSAPDSSDRR